VSPARPAVVHSVPTWLPKTATFLYNQVKYCSTEIENHVACDRSDNLDQFRVGNIHSQDALPASSLLLRRILRKVGLVRYSSHVTAVARRHRATLVHSHMGDNGWRDSAGVRRLGLPHVVTFYGKDVNFLPQDRMWRGRYEELFETVDAVLCEGPHMAGCIRALGCPAEKVTVQHLGVAVDQIPFRPRTWHPEHPLRVLISASFREKKGIPYALEALGLVKGELPGLEISIIGDADGDPRSQPEKQKILQVLEDFDLADCTRLLGYQPHNRVFREAYDHHVFMSASVTASDGDTEGGAPVTLIELAATGMPLLSTWHCDIPSVILHEDTGLLAPERDAKALAVNLTRLLDEGDRWPAMLSAARHHVEQEYNATTQGRRLAELYRHWSAVPTPRRSRVTSGPPGLRRQGDK
jgi:colanic acid/amylovoran biosynthesis glycosyltransferase